MTAELPKRGGIIVHHAEVTQGEIIPMQDGVICEYAIKADSPETVQATADLIVEITGGTLMEEGPKGQLRTSRVHGTSFGGNHPKHATYIPTKDRKDIIQ